MPSLNIAITSKCSCPVGDSGGFLIVGIILLTLFLNCSGLFYRVRTVHDEFDGYTKHILEGNSLGDESFLGALYSATIYFNVQKFISKQENVDYHIIIKYEHDGNWLFIDDGESLILLIDGVRKGFSGDGSSRHRDVVSVFKGSNVVELAYYKITAEELKQIANAKEVKVKLIGSQHYCNRHFTKSTFNLLGKFIKEYVD